MTRFFLLVCLCMTAFVMETQAQKKSAPLQVSLSADPSQPAQVGGKVLLTFTVHNAGTKAQKFCRYMTPIEGFKGNILQVTDASGARVSYKGVLKKRGKAGPEDYITLDCGESQTVSFDLLPAYPLATPGVYQVKFLGSKAMNGLLDSNVVEIVVE
jgi:hypothetical protein